MTQAPPAAARILVVRYRFIGDTILTVPFLRNLRQAYPNAQIDVLVGPQSGEVLEGCPYVNELITFDTTRFHKYDSGKGKPRTFWSYVTELRKKNYDTAFLLKRSLSSAFLALLIGCKNRIGYASSGRSFLLSKAVAWNSKIHEVESTLDVLRAVNIPIGNTEMEAWISPSEKAKLYQLVPELDPANRVTAGNQATRASKTQTQRKVLFHAAAAHPDKLYPLNHWARIIQTMAKENVLPFYTGSAQDLPVYEELEKLSGVKGVITAGKLSLRESMALLAEMDLAICTDSGPAHLAAAVGTPTIALFGPTDPERWRPWGAKHIALFDKDLGCRPCHYKKSCDDKRQCLTELSPDWVSTVALETLNKQNANGAVQSG